MYIQFVQELLLLEKQEAEENRAENQGMPCLPREAQNHATKCRQSKDSSLILDRVRPH